jgi:hypothetical protein
MRLFALLLAMMVGGCAEAHPPVDPRSFALRLETTQSVCSATAVAVDEIETAAHCLAHPLVSIDGQMVAIVSSHATGPDRLRVKLAGIRFGTWAKLGKAKAGDHVRWWGQPRGVPYVLRSGTVVAVYEDGIAVDGTICPGDSGSGLFNDAGELIGVVSAMTDQFGCTFVIAR